jgi:two-component system response regulator HydG
VNQRLGGLKGKGQRLLVVDDDDAMRFMVRHCLSRSKDAEGLVIEEASSGEAAIELLRTRRYDCVLSDYRMGAVSGVAVLAFCLKHQPSAFRVLFTGLALPEIQEEARRDAQVHAVFQKPMTMPDLETLLQKELVEPFLSPHARKGERLRTH